ncbi:MAG TPA: hypothetical protein VK508_15015 [Cyclobacteriaceae bacterium]|nr:hypothetical protein [Cyclobacteriaceae bacterium]
MTLKNHILIYVAILSISILSGCDSDDPQKEDVPELITKATLTFTPTTGSPIVVTATDPDGEGVQSISTDGPITLAKSTTYVLTISMINGLAQPTDEEYDITKEVEEEGDEHMLFFGWTGNAFSNPSGDGNIDARANALNYAGAENSKDTNGLPLGLTTTWTTADVGSSGAGFRVLLKHQPALKTLASTSNDGETDLDVTFQLSVQ